MIFKKADELVPIFPPSESEIVDFDSANCAISGPDVNIIDDADLCGKAVVDIIGNDSKVEFFTLSVYPFAVLHLNGLNRFFTIQFHVKDDCDMDRIFLLSNKVSNVTVNGNFCTIPMDIEDGWQRLCINLDQLLQCAFGSRFKASKRVAICGSCRIARLFYQGKDYADCQLPSFLRVAQAIRKSEYEESSTKIK